MFKWKRVSICNGLAFNHGARIQELENKVLFLEDMTEYFSGIIRHGLKAEMDKETRVKLNNFENRIGGLEQANHIMEG